MMEVVSTWNVVPYKDHPVISYCAQNHPLNCDKQFYLLGADIVKVYLKYDEKMRIGSG
jgi:hypothetical protein